eukprot:CAMPEP_0176496200 /NCGR_PEP_ID=MMETSP0200_2-20121128/11070_1 /TAXON_ID=947934 /ORGANISM="Chaetoceros sp., Strain GSL56" /LENGTH=822 /DNA_ID=CAMNT_0017894143 /DNA_START=133 /DNA_END=2598 /DNA_ORIENTATION=-
MAKRKHRSRDKVVLPITPKKKRSLKSLQSSAADHGTGTGTDHDSSSHHSQSDNHEEPPKYPITTTTIRKSPRKSIVKTTRKIHEMEMAQHSYANDDEEYSDQEGSDLDIKTFKATKKQRQISGGDDDSYREDESDDDDDDDDDDDLEDNEDYDDDEVENQERDLFNDEMSFENDMESSDDSESHSNRKSNSKSGGGNKAKQMATSRNINNDDIFDKEEEEDSDDNGNNDSVNKSRSPMKRVPVTPLKFKKIGQFHYESSDNDGGDNDDEKEITAISVKNGRAKDDHEDIELTMLSPKKIPLCTSEYDEITNELLPKLHICYIVPDGKSRHCFCLDTLYRAAILSGSKTVKNDGTRGLSFLQPPHFRTVMEDDLVDQIASRFGRPALVIEDSKVYKSELKRQEFQLEYDYDFDDDDEADEDRLSFRHRFNDYLNKQMGSGDIYCCPLCYSEAQRRFREGDDGEDDDSSSGSGSGSGNEDDSNENENGSSNDFEYNMDSITSYSQIDPMSILGSLDNDEFEVAASFCFHKLSQVKNHVRTIHNIDLSNVEVNDFFKRFMIRAQDGLLQRYLHAFWKHRIFAGAMRKYWFEGHNQNYILLRVLIDRRYFMNEIDHGFAEDHFCKSFPRRAVKIWRGLSAPYSKSDESDFIDSGEEDIDAVPHPIFEPPTESVEDAFVEHLRKKIQNTQRRKHGYDSSSSSDDEGDELKDDSGDDDEEVIYVDGNDEEDIYVEESSEDDWMASKRAKDRKNETMSRKKGRLKQNKDVLSDSDDNQVFSSSKSKNVAKTKVTQLSLSEDESESDEQSSDDEQSADENSEDSKELVRR